MPDEPDESITPKPQPAIQMRLALFAAGSALLGALVGGVAGLGATVYQANAERDLQVREERLAADFVTAGGTADLLADLDGLAVQAIDRILSKTPNGWSCGGIRRGR